ncbi:MAG: hypothetical protein K8I82_07175, partial [Anaerolineae bacterium]|nr:hypothetical protein [Anaerolineae bacterium]
MSTVSETLEARLATVTDPREKIDLLNELAWQLHHTDSSRSREFCLLARQCASETDPLYEDGLARSLSILSALEWDVSNYQDAFWLALEARGLLQKSGNLYQLAFVTNHLASISFYLGDYPHALELGYEALRLVEKSGNEELLASLLN